MFPMVKSYAVPTVRKNAYWPFSNDWFGPFSDMVGVPSRHSVHETDDAYLFDIEMPGFSSDEIEVTVHDSILSIQADHKAEDGDQHSFTSRSISRKFTIDGIDEEQISAKYVNGVLRIMLPKQKTQEATGIRRIEVL